MNPSLKKKTFAVIFTYFIALSLFWAFSAFAVTPSDITNSVYLTIHDDNYTPANQASLLKITESDGVTEILPDGSGNYNDIPADAKILLDYAFSLADGDGIDIYDYDGNEFFTATLPSGLNFSAATGTIVANDSVNGDYDLAKWSIVGNVLTVEFTGSSEDSYGKGGAANNAHTAKWGKVHIEGTFKTLNAGDPTTTEIIFGTQTIVINRQPLPMESSLAKSGVYDASTNEITWTVTVNPPAGDPTVAYDGYSVIDTFSSNQKYIPNTFHVNGVLANPGDLTIAAQEVSYFFPDTTPDTTGVQTITYKTSPIDFSSEDGSAPNREYSRYLNQANLMRGLDLAADPANANVDLNWMNKTGSMAATTTNPSIVKWTIAITVPGKAGSAVSGAEIRDTIQADLELFTDGTHPVEIQFGSGASTPVAIGGADGQYDIAGNVLTYRFPAANQPTQGTTATLTFYTRVRPAVWSTYLDSNNGISFRNGADFSWAQNTTPTNPSDRYTILNGILGGGLLAKSAGGTTNYIYDAADPGTIHWTITVNRNDIDIVNAKIVDIIPAGQKLLIGASNEFVVTNTTTSTIIETINSAVSTANFTYIDLNNFEYEFPEETLGTDTINSTYTVEYDTQILDPAGLPTLYSNATVPFTNGVTLTRTGTNISTTGTKNYSSQMIDKAMITAYNYDKDERTVQWRIVANRNRLPLTKAIITDELPDGMTLFINPTHLFTITPANGGAIGSLAGITGDEQFTITLPTPTSDQYTITFWTKMKEDDLKTAWNGPKNFTNKATIDADEIAAPISDTANASIRNPIISKTYDYTPGADTISWTAIINPAQVLLNDGVVQDVLNASLQLDPNSVELYTVTINNSTGEANAGGVIVDPETYTITLPTASNGNTLKIELPAATSSAYRLEFDTLILTDDINLSNTVSLTGSAGDPSADADSTSITINDLYSSGGSGPNELLVHKTDSGGKPLAGAIFRLLNVNKTPITNGGNEITATTDGNGDAIFSNLPSWIFHVEEIVPTPGYLIPTPAIKGGNRLVGTETINFTNELGFKDLTFNKIGAGSVLLSGGTFTLTGNDYANNPISMTSTAVNGIVTFIGLPPNKTAEPYTLQETVAPDGHVLNSTPFSATVDYNSTKQGLIATATPGILINTPVNGSVSFTKTDVAGTVISGGSFTLSGTDYLGNPVNKTEAAVGGTVTFSDISIGSYNITEAIQPDGYLMPVVPLILNAEVKYNATNTGLVTEIRNTELGTPIVTSYLNEKALGSFSFQKTDSYDNSPLSGGTFTLTGNDYAGNPVTKTASSVGGTVTFIDVPLGDDYTIKETTAPSGFKLSTVEIKATVKYNADKTDVETTIDTATLSNDRAPKSTYAKVSILKKDNEGKKIEGAEFALYSSSGNKLMTAVSGADGIALFDHVLKGTGYTIKETKAPVGYELSKEIISFDVNSSVVLTYTMINKKQVGVLGNILLLKKDDKANPLGGAEFTLYDVANKAISSVVTKIDGKAEFKDIPIGTYTVAETRAPLGYLGSDKRINVKISTGDTVVINFVNLKSVIDVGRFEIIKVGKNYRPLAGAQFTLYDNNAKEMAKVITGNDGLAVFEGLQIGKYSIKETKTPTGYVLLPEALNFEIKETKTFISYTMTNATEEDKETDDGDWIKNNESVLGVTKLPKTDGESSTLFTVLAGICSLLVGLLLL